MTEKEAKALSLKELKKLHKQNLESQKTAEQLATLAKALEEER